MTDLAGTPPTIRDEPTEAAKVSIQNRGYFPWLLMSPTLVILLVVGLFPFGYAIYLASTNIILSKPYLETFFVGLEQYQELMQDPDFFNALRITLVYSISAVFIEFWAGLGLALLFQRSIGGKSIYRLAILLPMVIPPLVVGLLWKYMLFPDTGLVSYYSNSLADFFGISPPAFLSSPSSALQTLIFIDVWQWTPFMFLILSAGLAAIPPEPYEAAEIDGASSWRVFWTITMPMLQTGDPDRAGDPHDGRLPHLRPDCRSDRRRTGQRDRDPEYLAHQSRLQVLQRLEGGRPVADHLRDHSGHELRLREGPQPGPHRRDTSEETDSDEAKDLMLDHFAGMRRSRKETGGCMLVLGLVCAIATPAGDLDRAHRLHVQGDGTDRAAAMDLHTDVGCLPAS